MKRVTLLLAVVILSLSTAFAQMEKNGTVYIQHPAIDVVESLNEAVVNGDSAKIASLLADDFKAFNGVSINPDPEGTNKVDFVKGSLRWSRELDYFDINDFPGSYPDAIKYDKDNEEGKVWVQTWSMITGVHKKTGVKFSSPGHRLFRLTKDNKIERIISYFNESIFDELVASLSDRTNGTIYDHHENINTVRKLVYAIEYGDVEKAWSFYSPDARFYSVESEYDNPGTLDEEMAKIKEFLDAFEIKSIEMVGYPDYLEYERNHGRSALSWWIFHLKRKADDKDIDLPVHFNHSFDSEGKITAEVTYFSRALLEQE